MFSEIQLAQSALAASTIQRQINHCCARTASNDCSFCQRTTAKQSSPLGRRSSARLRRIRRSGCAAAKHPGKPFKRDGLVTTALRRKRRGRDAASRAAGAHLSANSSANEAPRSQHMGAGPPPVSTDAAPSDVE
jgi:hypothetical protein